MLFLMDVLTLPSLVNLQKLQEIQSLQQNILYVPLWKLYMVCFMLTVVYPKYGEAFMISVTCSTAALS